MAKRKPPRAKAPVTRPHPPADRRQRFVIEYLVDQNATQAAIRAGYSKRAARAQGSWLLTKPDIRAAIRERQAARLERAELTADRTLEEMRRVAYFDIGAVFDEHGSLRPISELPPEVRSALASVEIVRQNITAGDGSQEWVHKIKAWDKPRVLEQLGKHFRLLIDRVEVDEKPLADKVKGLKDAALEQLVQLGDQAVRILRDGR